MKSSIFIKKEALVKEALKQLDESAERILLVVDDDQKLIGTLTDGDIRRYFLKGFDLNNTIEGIYAKKFFYFKKDDFNIKKIKKIMLTHKISVVPFINEDRTIDRYITWDEIFGTDSIKPFLLGNISVPVVIMAGGEGRRMKPFTNVLPKPLVPIGGVTLIETIINKFRQQNVMDFYVTLNHKASIIEFFLNDIEKDYKINFVKEKEYLGTAGSLKLLEGALNDVFVVSNCDVIVKTNFEDVLKFHKENRAVLTILSAIRHHKIPYGVIDYSGGGEVLSIDEKPEQIVTINTGVYIINHSVLETIPSNQVFDMPDLIKNLINQGKKVLNYPVNESDYIDVGQWDLYKNVLNQFDVL